VVDKPDSELPEQPEVEPKQPKAAPKQTDVEPTKAERRARVAYESERRRRLGVPAFAGGVLYLLGAITLNSAQKRVPTVGLIQGIAPVLDGQVNPATSPRAGEVRFYDHHTFTLIAGAVLTAAAVVALMFVLLFLFDAARFRRPQTASIARVLILVGGIGLPLLTVIGESVQAIGDHNFVTGHDFTTRAVEHALTQNAAYESLGFVTPLAAIALVAGMITLMVSTVRAGLQVRWMGIVGGVGAAVILIPTQELSLVTAFWMVGTGILLMGHFPGGDPPAWAAGAARPWPSQTAVRAERAARGGGGGRTRGGSKRGGGASDVVPEPVRPTSTSSADGKRRRKRGSRR
jgi:hypothetical protein